MATLHLDGTGTEVPLVVSLTDPPLDFRASYARLKARASDRQR
jgi:hypothetical protein